MQSSIKSMASSMLFVGIAKARKDFTHFRINVGAHKGSTLFLMADFEEIIKDLPDPGGDRIIYEGVRDGQPKGKGIIFIKEFIK